MDVKVFVSSTYRDMAADCRPAVVDAIVFADDVLRDSKVGTAKPINMEHWGASYLPALELCLAKIRNESTHYVGIIGYLRGFVPDNAGPEGVSITEAEWQYALKRLRRNCIAMFVPEQTSAIARKLRRRAKGSQTDAELEAQEAFHGRILSEGVAQLFTDPVNLGLRVQRQVTIWGQGGLRATARETTSPMRPGSADLTELGRRAQLNKFLEVFEGLSLPSGRRAEAFLIYGPPGFGHLELMARLVRAAEAEAEACRQPRHIAVSAGALWRENGPTAILRALSREIRAGWKPTEVPELAAELQGLLDEQDVILQVSGLQGYPAGVPGFLDGFWRPLVSALTASVPNRLVCLAAVETEDNPLEESLPEASPAGGERSADSPVVLPGLGPFTDEELWAWLRTRLPAARADSLTRRLMAATKGRPPTLYEVLADPALWEK
jgi:hypothetical protein